MAIEKVREYLKSNGYDNRIIEFSVSSATVPLAAAALNTDPDNIAKTLSFDLSGETVLIVASGNSRIDNSKYKAEFGKKAVMLPFSEVESRIGHAVGGVCPFAVNPGVSVYLDESLYCHETVYPAAGSENSAVKLSVSELEELSGFKKRIDVCRKPE